MDFIQLTPILPEISLAISAMVLLMVGVFKTSYGDGKKRAFLYKLTILSLVLAGGLLLFQDSSKTTTVFSGMFVLDGFAVFVKTIILLASVLILLVSFDFLKLKEKPCFEFSILMLLAVLGMMIVVSSNNFLSLYLGLELQSLSLYVMATIHKDSEKSSEAGLKYFMLGALASGMLLYGCSLIYGFGGTIDFMELSFHFSQAGQGKVTLGLLLGIIFLIIGICFKISAVPFHMWTPDVYEGAPKQITAFFATAPKVAAIALFIRVVAQPLSNLTEQWQDIVVFISIASMVVGSFGALKQTNIKRLMAYSSIGHAGFILVGVAAGTLEGIHAALVYLAIYVIMTIGVFTCIILMKRREKHVDGIKDLSGIGKVNPFFAFVMTILMLSMGGIPPMAGFFGKLFVFKAALESELYVLAITGVLASVVAAFYYLRIIKIMYFDEVGEPIDTEFSSETRFVLVGAGLLNLLFFVYPTPLLNAAKFAAETLML